MVAGKCDYLTAVCGNRRVDDVEVAHQTGIAESTRIVCGVVLGQPAEEVVCGIEVAADETDADETLNVEARPFEEGVVGGLGDQLGGGYFWVVDLIEDVGDGVEAGVVACVDGGEGLLLLLVAELEGAARDGEIV
jgi:hypothetical protein